MKRGKIIRLDTAGVSVRDIPNLENVPPQVVQVTIQRDTPSIPFPNPVDPENSPLTMRNSSATLSLIRTSHGLGLAISITSAEWPSSASPTHTTITSG